VNVRLPNGESALISDEKLYGYLLNREHPINAGHAELFHQLLGIGLENGEVLRAALAAAAREGNVVAGQPSPYGQKYAIRFPMTGPRGTYTILSVWIIDSGEWRPRLVTAFVE
jgi:hypothetical protein